MSFSFKRKKVYTMNSEIASETLSQVMRACEREPVTIPFDELIDRSRPRTAFCNAGKIISVFMLLLTFFTPLMFPHSPVSFTQTQNSVSELTLSSHYIMNGNLYLQFYGDTIDPKKCYLLTDSGTRFTCSSYNEKKGLISFPYYGEGANIYIESSNGTVLQILMTLKNN